LLTILTETLTTNTFLPSLISNLSQTSSSFCQMIIDKGLKFKAKKTEAITTPVALKN